MTRVPPELVMAKTRLPAASNPRPCSSWTQYTRLWAMTSSVISSCAFVVCWARSSAARGRGAPRGSEGCERHFELPFGCRLGGLVSEEGPQGPEGERVQQGAERLPAGQLASP